jgi:hypothetical protein
MLKNRNHRSADRAPANRPMKAKCMTLNELAVRLEHDGLSLSELEEFACKAYINAQEWKGAFLGLALVNLLVLISCIAFN